MSDYTKGDADSLLSSLGVNQQERLEIAEMYSKAMLKVKPSKTIRPPFSSFIEHLSYEAKQLLQIPTNSEEAPQKPVEPKVKKKPGRPKGSLNKRTIAAMEAKAKAEQEAIARGEPLPVVEKPKMGRPKGSLNKSTIAAMEAKAKADQETSVVQSGAAESEANPSTDLESFSCNTDFGYDDSQNNSLCKQDCASSMLSSNNDLAADFNTGFDLNSYWFN